MNSLLQDFRDAIRSLLKAPGFAAVAIATLALGIGANAAMFSIVRGVLLRPLPYRDVDRLVTAGISVPDYRDLREASRTLDRTAIWASNQYSLTRGDEAEPVLGGVVSTEFFTLLGGPARGRVFAPEDARSPVVVLSDRLWRSRFGSDPAVLGRTIELSGKPYSVIGVMPAGFEFPRSDFELWVPFDHSMATAPSQGENRALRIFRLLAHRRAGATLAAASAEAAALSRRLQKQYPDSNSGVEIELRPLREALLGGVRSALLVLLATVGLVLLIACANVANLTLARVQSREQEIAVRSALGASRWRLVRHLLAESVALALAGGAAGATLAAWAVSALPRFAPARMPRLENIHVDASILLMGFVVSVVTGVVFGLLPALEGSRTSLSGRLQEGGRGSAGGRRSRGLRHALVVAEVALSVVVLVGAGLLVRSLDRLLHVEPGFRTENLLTFLVDLSRFEQPERRAEVARRVVERLSRVPGVVVAGAGTGLPPETPQRGTSFAVQGRPLADPDESRAYFVAATPGYFGALGTRVFEGRVFTDSDRAGAPPVVVVSRGLARRLFPTGSAVGHSLRLVNRDQTPEWRTIVGVVDNIRYSGLDDPGASAIYTPFPQTPFLWSYGMLRTSVPPETLAAAVRDAVRSVEPGIVASRLRPMEELVEGSVAQPRFQTRLLSGFGALALLLAAVGIYGVISYGVGQRRREIGIRVALGAQAGQVLRLFAGQGLRLVALGLAVGLVAALAATRLLRGLLYEVGTTDPLTFAAIAAILAAVGFLASWLPGLRAARVDPMTALRDE
ncbi:MAG: ABC transporter permease [Acidobacteriota bacterium]